MASATPVRAAALQPVLTAGGERIGVDEGPAETAAMRSSVHLLTACGERSGRDSSTGMGPAERSRPHLRCEGAGALCAAG
jgi:hypothetical protein